MFKSFFMAGFECAAAINKHQMYIDEVTATQHDLFLQEDYKRVAEAGMMAVREGIRWRLVDQQGKYDFTSVIPIFEAAEKTGVTVIYDLFHFGYPDHIDLFGTDFPKRFEDYCRAVAEFVKKNTPGPWYFTPINEPSYFSWAAGEVGLFAPHACGRGWELKVCLLRALIRGIRAIRSICGDSRFVNADSLCRTVAPLHEPHRQQQVHDFNNIAVFQSWDILAGKLLPELGGRPEILDIIGVNYYWTNQWEFGCSNTPLRAEDPRIQTIQELIQTVADRYDNDIIITETSHRGENRATWLRELTYYTLRLLNQNVPLKGICIYPAIGMFEWHEPETFTPMGLWDLVRNGKFLKRVPHEAYLKVLKKSETAIQSFLSKNQTDTNDPPPQNPTPHPRHLC